MPSPRQARRAAVDPAPSTQPDGGVASGWQGGRGRRSVRLAAASLAGVFALLYAVISLLRAAHLGTAAFDLGIFDQAVRSYAHLNAPMTPLKGPGFNLLGDHFSPILAVLAPLYWLWPSANLLLVAQAVLLGGSAYPLTRLAIERTTLAGGLALGAAYGLSWGLAGAVSYDFHEVAFAVPLLAFGLVALAERRWRSATLWTLPLVLVKEDLGITVAAIGCYLLAHRRWRLGGGAVAVGLGATAVETLVIIPRLDHVFHTYRYWGVVSDGAINTTPPPGLGSLAKLVVGFPHAMVSPPAKLALVFWFLAVTAFVALRSPLVLLAVPTLAWRLVSTNPSYWSTGTVHYNAVLMPMAFAALADAAGRLRGSTRRTSRALAALALPAALAIAVGTLPRFSFGLISRPGSFPGASHVAAARAVAAQVPNGAQVAATDYLVPLLVDRAEVITFPDYFNRPTRYVLVDSTNLYGLPFSHDRQVALARALPSQGFTLLTERDGVRLYARR